MARRDHVAVVDDDWHEPADLFDARRDLADLLSSIPLQRLWFGLAIADVIRGQRIDWTLGFQNSSTQPHRGK